MSQGRISITHTAPATKDQAERIQNLLDKLPTAFSIALSVSRNIVLAGGAARRLYEGVDINGGDVDIFIDTSRYEYASSVFDGSGWELTETIENSYGKCKYYVKDDLKVNLIVTPHNDSHGVITNFDLTVCQVAIDFIDRKPIFRFGSHTRFDLSARSLRPTGTALNSADGFIRRLEKYIQLGYGVSKEAAAHMAYLMSQAAIHGDLPEQDSLSF